MKKYSFVFGRVSGGGLGPEESFESSIICSIPDFKRLPDFWLELRAIQTKRSRKTQKEILLLGLYRD